MSKYIELIPLDQVAKIAVVEGKGRSMAQVKGNADYIMNGGFYDMGTGKPINHLKIGGKVLACEAWTTWGYAWENVSDLKMAQLPSPKGNCLGGVSLLTPWDGPGNKLTYPREIGGDRGRTAMALTGDKLLLYCSGDGTKDGATPEQVRDELYRLGAETALLLDGGGSSQCDFRGKTIPSSRRVHNYVCVWLKKPEKEEPMGKTVVLDAGHGIETKGKRSPDGSFLEYFYNLDMAERVKDLLTRHGVKVVLTRGDDHDVSLLDRVAISNREKPDLFVSLHFNASGDGKDWTSPDGLGVITYRAGTSVANEAAKGIIKECKQAGVNLWGGGLHYDPTLYVLKHTVAPAMLIEHGFYTNKAETALMETEAYRAKLAEIDCKGILSALGIPWQEDKPGGETGETPADWAAEAIRWAVSLGIVRGNGTGSLGLDKPITKREELVMLHRLYKAIKAGK